MKKIKPLSLLLGLISSVTLIGSDINTIHAESDIDFTAYESLKEAYADYFTFGNIMEPNQLSDQDLVAMYKHHYNYITFENALKPAYVARRKGAYNFRTIDTLVDWALENDIQVHGHTLVWHSQSAAWLNKATNGTILTREEAKANMEEYINTVAGHYAGRIASWDVVNEAFTTSVSSPPAMWQSALRTNELDDGSPWYQAYANGADADKGETGADYIYDAYVLTRLAAPDAILYYNDFNETSYGKREAIAMMVEELNAKWKEDPLNTEPDRLLIEGIGMQSHFFTSDLKVSDVEATIVRFIKTGAEISVTELDIPFDSWNTYKSRTAAPNEEELAKQAELYKQVFEIYKKYSDNIARVTIWGKIDNQSWRHEGYPLIFDSKLNPKPAYHSIIEVAHAIVEEEVADEEVDENPANNSSAENDEPDTGDLSSNESNNQDDDDPNAIVPIIIAAAVLVLIAIIIIVVKKRK